jgi:hypothetical protein
MSTICDMPGSDGSGGVYTIQCDKSPALRYCPQEVSTELRVANGLDARAVLDPDLPTHSINDVDGGMRHYTVVASHFYPVDL